VVCDALHAFEEAVRYWETKQLDWEWDPEVGAELQRALKTARAAQSDIEHVLMTAKANVREAQQARNDHIRLCLDKGVGVRELAGAIGIAPSQISSIGRGGQKL
jgi:hypothetical protein